MRAVVLGGGYAGVVVASRLEGFLEDDDELVVVDEDGTHLIRHQLHRLIRRPDLKRRVKVPLSRIVDRGRIHESRVVSIDTADRTVHLSDGSALSYDVAAVCLGSTPAYDDLPGVESNSIPVTSTQDVLAIREQVLDVIDRDSSTVVVAGAGLTGIQVAGELAALQSEGNDGRGNDLSITLLEQADSVAPGFGPGMQEELRTALERSGVEVRTGTSVAGASESAVHLAGEESIDVDTLVWTGGIAGPNVFDGSRPTVRADLQLADSTFVAGDAARVIDVNGTEATPSAQTAIRQATVAAKNIQSIAESTREPGSFRPRLERYRYDPFAWVVSVGDEAVATVGSQVLTGTAARAIKSTVGVGYLASAGGIREAVGMIRSSFGFEFPGRGPSGT
ncbi:MAG: NAD(P)/FAD-dependent oxidoreductase [Halodesulfurarchaeum sp.]